MKAETEDDEYETTRHFTLFEDGEIGDHSKLFVFFVFTRRFRRKKPRNSLSVFIIIIFLVNINWIINYY